MLRILILTLFFCLPLRAEPIPEDALRFCRFGPKMQVFEPVMGEGRERCAGSAKIHGVMWGCLTENVAKSQLPEYFATLKKQAEKLCQKHCANRAKGCTGSFRIPAECGRAVDFKTSAEFGKNACRPGCAGQHFIYCALYDTDFKTKNPKKINEQAANCICS